MPAVLFFLLAGFAVAIILFLRQKPRVSYPPGLPPKPFIGNALDMLSEMPWVKYLEWSKCLDSDIIHMSAMNIHIVVLHKMEDIIELLEKRSAIYSNRPWTPVAELLGIDKITPLITYGNEWRKQRSIFQEGFKKEQMSLYEGIYTEKAHLMLGQLLSNPDAFRDHGRWLSVAVMMSIMFGYDDIAAGDAQDKYITTLDKILTVIPKLCDPAGTVINVIPFLRHIPPWMPGASTQRLAARIKELTMACKNEPFEYVKSNLLAGTSKDCVLAKLLKHRMTDDGLTFREEDELRETMASIYLASTETIQGVQLVFLMAMALHPSAQRRIQAEIDRVVGTNRLPTFEDRPSLPLVDAALRESLRWRLVAPLAVPHTSVKDDTYKGFYIPKGTLVLANGWAISQDETRYPNPDVFYPERFLKSDGSLNEDKVGFAFGYGRRICPGENVARDVLWIMMASVLSTFTISKAKDAKGVEVDIDPNAFTFGLSSSPKPFKCSFVPRSPRAAALIRTAVTAAEERMSIE